MNSSSRNIKDLPPQDFPGPRGKLGTLHSFHQLPDGHPLYFADQDNEQNCPARRLKGGKSFVPPRFQSKSPPVEQSGRRILTSLERRRVFLLLVLAEEAFVPLPSCLVMPGPALVLLGCLVLPDNAQVGDAERFSFPSRVTNRWFPIALRHAVLLPPSPSCRRTAGISSLRLIEKRTFVPLSVWTK